MHDIHNYENLNTLSYDSDTSSHDSDTSFLPEVEFPLPPKDSLKVYNEIKFISKMAQDTSFSALISLGKYHISLSEIHPLLKFSIMVPMAVYQFYTVLQNIYCAPFILASEIELSIMLLNTFRARAEASNRN